MFQRSSILGISLSALVVVACGGAGEPRPDEQTKQSQSAIINGALDTTHQAVVAIVLQSGRQDALCSGTIVKVDPQTNIGWVLTAAHCVTLPPVVVVQGDDFSSANVLKYDVVDYAADPRYAPGGSADQPYDVAVVRIAGVDAQTPSIPMSSSRDGVVEGTAFAAVGYGRTSLISSGDGAPNSQRRSVNLSVLAGGIGSTQYAYDQSSRGVCQGDSGGPDLVGGPGAERVIGVHSFVQGDCNGIGASGRVSGNLSFLDGELARAAPARDCALCEKIVNSGTQTCASLTRACLADKECGGFYDCLSKGGTKTACLAKFPKAEGPFNAAANCSCTQGCVAECGKGLECRNVPKCGYAFERGDCATCAEASCCAEALACTADGTGYQCLKTGDAAPECSTNAARKKLATCAATKCAGQCTGSAVATGADPPATEEGQASPSATTTTTTSGCTAGPRPVSGEEAWAGLALAGALFGRRRRRWR